jgi:hypothetical protein
MNAVKSAVAMCDPRIVAGAIFSDEGAYRVKNVELRMTWDTATLPILTHAAFLFDTVIAEPLMIMGLKPILGYNFLEIFGSTIKKVQECGFVAFNPADYVAEDHRDRLNKLLQFLSELRTTERGVRAMASDTTASWSDPVESALLYSRLGGLPFVGSDGRIQPPTLPTQTPAPTDTRHFTILAEILSVELPNLRATTLDDVLDIRSTTGAEDFRQIMRELVATLSTDILDDPTDLERIIRKWSQVKNEAVDVLVNEFRSDISGWSPVKAGFSVLLDIAGFIPGVSIAAGTTAAIKDTGEFLKFLAKKKKLRELGFLSFLAEIRSKSSEGV